MPPLEVLETCLCVNDLAAAEKFYSEVLGLTVHSRQPGRHVFFRCGRGMLLLFNPEQSSLPGDIPPHGTQGAGHVAFAAAEAELPAWRNHLEGHGVVIERFHAWPGGGHSLYFRDPAGNSLEIATPAIWGKG
jgi:catechol 2,3-dioxygenase-like lactoylglutathione lyase family enzyme